MHHLVHVLDAKLHVEHVVIIVEQDVRLDAPMLAEAAAIPLVLLHAKVVVVIVPMVVDQVVLAGAVQHVIHVLMGVVHVPHVEVHAPTVVLVDAVEDVIAAVTAIRVVMDPAVALAQIHALGSARHAMVVPTVAAVMEHVQLAVILRAMQAHIQWRDPPGKEKSGSWINFKMSSDRGSIRKSPAGIWRQMYG